MKEDTDTFDHIDFDVIEWDTSTIAGDSEQESDAEEHHNITLMANLHAGVQVSFQIISTMIIEAIMLTIQRAEPIPYHMSILSGHGWLQELLNSHPECIHT